MQDANAFNFTVQAKFDFIDAVKLVYTNLNPHRFLHENFLKVDFPAALDAINPTEEMTNVEFYDKMINAFQMMDDKHSIFLVPPPLNSSVALLGFSVKKFYEGNSTERKYLVDDVIPGVFSDSSFGVGSELVSIDDVPIDDHILAAGKDSYGSNEAAQIDTAISTLTFRILLGQRIPVNTSVDIVYLTPNRTQTSITLPWKYVTLPEDDLRGNNITGQVHPSAYETLSHSRDRATFTDEDKRKLFEPVLAQPLDVSTRIVVEGRVPIKVNSEFEDNFSAEIILTKSGPIGRFVIPDFGAEVTLELALEIARILRLMPKVGLIMDLRANGGGRPNYVKLLAESLVAETVASNPTVLRATGPIAAVLSNFAVNSTESDEELLPLFQYSSAVNTALAIGEPFSGPSASLYDARFAERFAPRAYFGPVVTLVDGLCYSGGDLFTSLQKDYGFSTVVGVSDNVGAGGATTVPYSALSDEFPEFFPEVAVGFTTAFARFYRSGTSAGGIIENFGVEPDVRYFTTRNDALKDDCDLYEFLGKILTSGDAPGEGPTDNLSESPGPDDGLEPMSTVEPDDGLEPMSTVEPGGLGPFVSAEPEELIFAL